MDEKLLKENSDGVIRQKKDYLLPSSILISAVLVSAALVYNVGKKEVSLNINNKANLTENAVLPTPLNVRPVSEKDHILGNIDAPIKIVEFSDLECPFCKRFHLTMKQALKFYGDKVAWVYRHFPLDDLHSKARKEAEAAECAAELGDNSAFWAYINRVFEITPSNNGLDPNLLPQIAADIGLNRKSFEDCLLSGRHAERVEADVKDALNSGARGTPYSIIVARDGKKYAIPGALPFESDDPTVLSVKLFIDEALK
jgi:protein-disulfide isomerase